MVLEKKISPSEKIWFSVFYINNLKATEWVALSVFKWIFRNDNSLMLTKEIQKNITRIIQNSSTKNTSKTAQLARCDPLCKKFKIKKKEK